MDMSVYSDQPYDMGMLGYSEKLDDVGVYKRAKNNSDYDYYYKRNAVIEIISKVLNKQPENLKEIDIEKINYLLKLNRVDPAISRNKQRFGRFINAKVPPSWMRDGD